MPARSRDLEIVCSESFHGRSVQLAVRPTIEVVGVSAGEYQEDPAKVLVPEGSGPLTSAEVISAVIK